MQPNHSKRGANGESQDFKANKASANKRMQNLELFEGSKGAHLLNRTDEDPPGQDPRDANDMHVSV